MNDDPFQLVGTVLDGRYRIDAVAGEGGFGVVYKSYHLGFKAPIAIKVLKIPSHLSGKDRQKFLTTFDDEGSLLFALSARHPAFVRVTEKGMTRTPAGIDAPFLVLEWLDGESLEVDLERRRAESRTGRSLVELIRLLTPVAEALALAHDQKIAHRDVKPANIFINPAREDLSARLLDFGIAKVMSSTGSAAVRDTAEKGGAMFSPNYSAPEQWDRAKYGATGPWTDVYAFALICVEILTDRAALDGDEIFQFMGATTSEERPTPSARGVIVPMQVEAVFRKALALHVRDRFASMSEFWPAFVESVRASAEPPNPKPTSPPSHQSTIPAAPLPISTERLTPKSQPAPQVVQGPRVFTHGGTLRATVMAPAQSSHIPVVPAASASKAQTRVLQDVRVWVGATAVLLLALALAFGGSSRDKANADDSTAAPIPLPSPPKNTVTPVLTIVSSEPQNVPPRPSASDHETPRTLASPDDAPTVATTQSLPGSTDRDPQNDGDSFDRTLEDVHLRAEPGLDSKKLRTIPAGVKVRVMDEAWGGWIKIYVDGQTGYIHRSRLGRCDQRKGDVDCRWLKKSCVANRCR